MPTAQNVEQPYPPEKSTKLSSMNVLEEDNIRLRRNLEVLQRRIKQLEGERGVST